MADIVLLFMVIGAILVIAGICLACAALNQESTERFGTGVISYSWAFFCAVALWLSYSSWNISSEEWPVILGGTVILWVFSMRRCRKKALTISGDKNFAKRAGILQMLAPVGILGVLLLLCLVFGGKGKQKRK